MVEDRAGIADRHDVIAPVAGELPDACDHLLGGHLWSGIEFPLFRLAGGEDFDVGAADVDDQYIHGPPHCRRAPPSLGRPERRTFLRCVRSRKPFRPRRRRLLYTRFRSAGARRSRRGSCRRCARASAVTSSPAQSRARRAPRPPYSVQGRAFFRTPYRGARTRSASPENHWTNEIFCRQRQKTNVLWSGARSPNAKTVLPNARNSSVASVHRQAIAMAGIVQEFRRTAEPAPRTSAHRPFGRPCCAPQRAGRTRGAASAGTRFSRRAKDFRPNGCSMRSALSPPSVRSTSS